MPTYLQVHPPRRAQFRLTRRATPTGLTVVHTTESALDAIAPDTGAEQVAAFIAGRTDPGSYHDLVDSDSALQLVPYDAEAYQDGTGSNPYALAVAFACRASDWTRMPAARREAFLRQGALAVGRQQAWLRSKGYPTTPPVRVTRLQSNRGVAGFISHGERDPARRTDPGPHFPWARFLELCGGTRPAPDSEDPDVFTLIRRPDGLQALISPARCIVSPPADLLADYAHSGMLRQPVGKPVQHSPEAFARLCLSLGVRVP